MESKISICPEKHVRGMNEKSQTERNDIWDILLLSTIYEDILKFNKTS